MANFSATPAQIAQQSAAANALVQNFETQYTQALTNAQLQYNTAFIAGQGAFCSEEITLMADHQNVQDLQVQYDITRGQSIDYDFINQCGGMGALSLGNALSSISMAAANATAFVSSTGVAALAIEAALKSIVQLTADVAAVAAMVATEDKGSDMSKPANIALMAANAAGQQAEQASYDALNLTISVAQSSMSSEVALVTDAQTNCLTLTNAIASTSTALQASTMSALNAYIQASTAQYTEQLTNDSLRIAADTADYMLTNVNGYIAAYNAPSPPIPVFPPPSN